MNRLMQEGGIADDGMNIDPVSGNEVPPGSMAEEVRDDIPAQLSDGEYVVSADVLRYYGVAFFEKLREKAKRGLAEMEAGGRIGGEPVPMRNGMEMEEEDDLDDEDEMMLNEVMGMAQGGMSMSQPQQANNYYGLQPTMNIDRQTVSAFQQGGMAVDVNNPAASAAQFKGAFDPTKYGPGFLLQQTGQPPATGTAAPVEMRTYVNAQGEIRMIPFQNGAALEPIPEGFFPQGQVPAQTQVQQQEGSSDRDEQEDTSNRAEEWAKTNYERIRNDPLAAAAATKPGMIENTLGAVIPGVKSLMAVDRIQQLRAIQEVATANGNTEAATRIQSDIDALVDNLGIIGKGILNMSKTNPYTQALQTQAGITGATTSVTGGEAAKPPSAPPAAAPAEDKDRPDVFTPPPAAAAPVGSRGTGATATAGKAVSPTTGQGVTSRGTTALEGPEAGPVTRVAQDQKLGAGARGAAKGGLMQKPKPKKAAQKRNIKTVST